MKPWKAILAAMIIFVAGLVSGAMATHLYRAKHRQASPPSAFPGGPPSPWMGYRMELLRRLGDRLKLTPEQRERIDRLVDESQRRLKTLWDPIAPKAHEEMRVLRQQIDAELTAEQREAFDKLMREKATRSSGEPGAWKRREGRTDGDTNRASGTNHGTHRAAPEGQPPPPAPPH